MVMGIYEYTRNICSWFFGDVDRKEAERCLTRDPRIRDGTFLVRTTISKKTSDSKHKFSLSIKVSAILSNE